MSGCVEDKEFHCVLSDGTVCGIVEDGGNLL